MKRLSFLLATVVLLSVPAVAKTVHVTTYGEIIRGDTAEAHIEALGEIPLEAVQAVLRDNLDAKLLAGDRVRLESLLLSRAHAFVDTVTVTAESLTTAFYIIEADCHVQEELVVLLARCGAPSDTVPSVAVIPRAPWYDSTLACDVTMAIHNLPKVEARVWTSGYYPGFRLLVQGTNDGVALGKGLQEVGIQGHSLKVVASGPGFLEIQVDGGEARFHILRLNVTDVPTLVDFMYAIESHDRGFDVVLTKLDGDVAELAMHTQLSLDDVALIVDELGSSGLELTRTVILDDRIEATLVRR
jgi:hypothetical protein